MKGIITAYNAVKCWGFIKDENGNRQFFHADNSPDLKPELGIAVEFELGPPFRLGQPDQAVNLRRLENSQVKEGA